MPPLAFDPWSSEQLLCCSDPEAGLRAVIVLDDSTLGPGFGGVRLASYESAGAAIVEAQRLAAAMTVKHAVAELPYGGAKAVILDDPGGMTPSRRAEVVDRFGDVVAGLSGRFIPGIDMGTTAADMIAIRERGARVFCADASAAPWTARGAFVGMSAGVCHAFGDGSLAGRVVAIQGAGRVGSLLARFVAADGGRVLVADVDPDRAWLLAEEVGGRAIDTQDAPFVACDVFAPCSIARVIRPDLVPRLGCRVVAGAANGVLDDGASEALQAAGITYVPDVVMNSGGVIHEHGRASGWDDATVAAAVDAIGPRALSLLQEADAEGITPHEATMRRAARRIAAAS